MFQDYSWVLQASWGQGSSTELEWIFWVWDNRYTNAQEKVTKVGKFTLIIETSKEVILSKQVKVEQLHTSTDIPILVSQWILGWKYERGKCLFQWWGVCWWIQPRVVKK